MLQELGYPFQLASESQANTFSIHCHSNRAFRLRRSGTKLISKEVVATMRAVLLLICSLMIAGAADESWTALKALKSGTELKIYERGQSHPRQARFADATDENLIVIVKNEELAIPRAKIDRVDSRSAKKSGPAVTSTTKTEDVPVVSTEGPQGPTAGPSSNYPGGSNSSTSTSIAYGAPEYRTVYRRSATAPVKHEK